MVMMGFVYHSGDQCLTTDDIYFYQYRNDCLLVLVKSWDFFSQGLWKGWLNQIVE